MDLSKKSPISLNGTFYSEGYRQHRFVRNNSNSTSNSRSRSVKSIASSQSSSHHKFYVKNAYAIKQLSPNRKTAKMKQTQKIKQNLDENQRNSRCMTFKYFQIQESFANKTTSPTISIRQLLEQFSRLKEIVKAQAKINIQQKLLLQQVRNENQALKKFLKREESKKEITSKQRSINQIDRNQSFVVPGNRGIAEQNLMLLESNQVNKLQEKIKQIQQQNFLLRKMLSKQSYFWDKGLKQSSDSEFLSMQPYIQKMKVQLYQARQQVKRLNLQNDNLQRKNYKQVQSALKSRKYDYDQLKKKHMELLDKYRNINKLHSESMAQINRLKKFNQNLLKESFNFSQISAHDTSDHESFKS